VSTGAIPLDIAREDQQGDIINEHLFRASMTSAGKHFLSEKIKERSTKNVLPNATAVHLHVCICDSSEKWHKVLRQTVSLFMARQHFSCKIYLP